MCRGSLPRTPVVEQEVGRQSLIGRVEDDLCPTHTPLLENSSCVCGLLMAKSTSRQGYSYTPCILQRWQCLSAPLCRDSASYKGVVWSAILGPLYVCTARECM